MGGRIEGLLVRAAEDDDVAAIQRIYAPQVLHGVATFEEQVPDLDELRARMRKVRARGLPYLVAQHGDEVVGYAYAGTHRERAAYRYTVEDSVYIDERFRGRGVGRALLAAVIAGCEQAGVRQLVAVIGDSANAGSVRLHAACGFAMIGTMPAVGWKFGRWIDTVVMQRAIGVGSAAPAAPNDP